MNENQIRKLIKLVEESDIESLEISRWGHKIRIVGKGGTAANDYRSATTAVAAPVAPAPTVTQAAPALADAPPVEDIGNLVAVKSPMVGTFYAAPAPDADQYVSLNEKISVGQVLCIVEAMKLMNEIEAEVSGRIVKIEAQNAQPVEYGQTLFLVDPNG